MKQPIAWHKDCLKNVLVYLEQKRLVADRAVEEFQSLQIKADNLTKQIAAAEKEGKPAFDADKYLFNRTHK